MDNPLEKATLNVTNVCQFCGDDCPVGFSYCHCGCGQKTTISDRNWRQKNGPAKGMPFKYIAHHSSVTRKVVVQPFPSTCLYCEGTCLVGVGYCHCGCGSLTGISVIKRRRPNDIAPGLPYKYFGHHAQQKLNDAQVREVRNRIIAGERIIDIADAYNVSKGLISKIGTLTERSDAGI